MRKKRFEVVAIYLEKITIEPIDEVLEVRINDGGHLVGLISRFLTI